MATPIAARAAARSRALLSTTSPRACRASRTAIWGPCGSFGKRSRASAGSLTSCLVGVMFGRDGAAGVTDVVHNAIVRFDQIISQVALYPLPGRNANLNTATFDTNGVLWFTGQNGVYGRLDPTVGQVQVFDAPRGPGPY